MLLGSRESVLLLHFPPREPDTPVTSAFIGSNAVVASSTRSALIAAPVLGLLFLSACSKGDARLEKLSAGISKDSVLAIMGGEKPQRVDPFLVNGQYIEAMYFPKPGAADSASLADRNMSPVVVVDGKLVGWGWKQWDSIAAEKKIPVAEAGR